LEANSQGHGEKRAGCRPHGVDRVHCRRASGAASRCRSPRVCWCRCHRPRVRHDSLLRDHRDGSGTHCLVGGPVLPLAVLTAVAGATAPTTHTQGHGVGAAGQAYIVAAADGTVTSGCVCRSTVCGRDSDRHSASSDRASTSLHTTHHMPHTPNKYHHGTRGRSATSPARPSHRCLSGGSRKWPPLHAPELLTRGDPGEVGGTPPTLGIEAPGPG
jgi:hypothetical protein